MLGLIVGWWLAGRALRPIQTISQTASRISEGNLEERIDVAGGASELDQLGHVLNRTFDRLQAALERQRQFTADVAHELRTPITILTTETQRILKRSRTPEEYRSAFESCAEAVARMRRLVEDLLLIAKQESVTCSHEVYDLAAIVRETIGELAPLALAKNIRIQSALQSANGYGRPTAISVVSNNLLRNAIQHHGGGGTVSVSTLSNNGHVLLVVQDDGPGIPPEDLPRIFDRFYRVDKARTNDESLHTGLGLSIVKAIVSAEGGSVCCESIVGKGASFTVALPRQRTH
jgi:two-component system, OmpR family, sensor kinase